MTQIIKQDGTMEGPGSVWVLDANGRAKINAHLLDGLHADAFALSGHNHDAVYAALSHNHDHGALTGRGDDDHTQYLLASGARALSNNWDAGNYQVRARTFYADVATGTAPLTIASTTRVANLNADLLDGLHADATGAADAHVVATDANGDATVVDLTATGGLNLGTATGAGAGQALIKGSSGPVLRAERSVGGTNTLYGVSQVKVTTSGDMADGFGAMLYFSIEDSAGTDNLIAGIIASRYGADNSGALRLNTYASGSLTEVMRLLPARRVLIGTTSDDGINKLQVSGSIKATGGLSLGTATGAGTGEVRASALTLNTKRTCFAGNKTIADNVATGVFRVTAAAKKEAVLLVTALVRSGVDSGYAVSGGRWLVALRWYDTSHAGSAVTSLGTVDGGSHTAGYADVGVPALTVTNDAANKRFTVNIQADHTGSGGNGRNIGCAYEVELLSEDTANWTFTAL